MEITQTQLEQFCSTIRRGSSQQGKAKVIEGLKDLGVTVRLTPVEQAQRMGTALIGSGRANDLRAALRLLDRERISHCTDAEALRLLDYFGNAEDEF